MNLEKQLKKMVSEFLVHLGIDFTELVLEDRGEKTYWINVISEEPSLLIGHHGENLQAMQKLLKIMCHREFGDDTNIAFDVDSYRKRQEENVLSIAKQKIQEVRNTQIQTALPAMSPYFRRIVHLFVRDGNYEDICTESVGDGNYRQVVIKPRSFSN